MTVTTIKQVKVSKRQQKREKRAQKERELKQLANSSLPKPNINNPVKGLIAIPKKQQLKEESLRQFMNELDQNVNPENHRTTGMGNYPMSRYAKWKTEFESQRDKLPKNVEGWRNSRIPQKVGTTTEKLANGHIIEVPVIAVCRPILPKKSPSAGIGHISLTDAEKIRAHNAKIYGKPEEKKETYIEENPNRFNDTVVEEKKYQHELK